MEKVTMVQENKKMKKISFRGFAINLMSNLFGKKPTNNRQTRY